MPKFEQFSYKEALPKRSNKALPGFLKLSTRQSEEVILLRLLLGTISIQNLTFGGKIEQRVNYAITDFENNKRLSAKVITDFFKGEKIPIVKAENYFGTSITRGNKVFFKNLLLEISNYFYQKSKQSYATAFLHLYRSVELISYCFPLHYASQSKSYEKTYSSLKDYFVKSDGGELSFLRIFVNDHLFKGDPLLDIHLPIKISAPKPLLQTQYFNAIQKLCNGNKNIDVKSTTPNSEIIISRRGLISLTIDLRNRYFHLLTGDHNNNFSSSELSEIDHFYYQMNDTILNWICLIYLEILKESILN